jgi:2'-5' RNA ligase
MIRLFVALSLPETLRLRLSSLGGGVPGARWVKPENLHLTLRFIGEVDHGAADDLDAALGGIVAPAFDLSLAGVGYFGKANATRLLWAGVQPDDALNQLQSKVEAAVTQAGFPAEQRRFSPHVTLARPKRAPAERIEEFIANQAGFHAGPITIDHFTLFSSFLSAKGAIYTPEAEYGLIG